jgi:hypothetical protein
MKFSGLKTIKVLITYSFTLNKNNLYLNIDKIRAGVAFPIPARFPPPYHLYLTPPHGGKGKLEAEEKRLILAERVKIL